MTGWAEPAEKTSGLERLRRITSSGKFIPQIDGLRFVAIALVVLYHIRSFLLERGGPFAASSLDVTRMVEHGHYGVQLFFVISGFILALPFASHYLNGGRPVVLREYFLRRVTRLEPPYVISMLLFFALLVSYVGRDIAELWPHLLASLLYLHNIVFGSVSAINGVAWSLEVEIQFYLLVPLLARIFTVRDVRWRRGLILSAMAALVVFQALATGGRSEAPRWLAYSILGQLQFFLVGFLLADIFLREWRFDSEPRRAWDVVSLVGWPALFFVWTKSGLSAWVFPPLALVLYCAALRGPWSRRVFGTPWVTAIGGMCYTIYLLHYPIISFLGGRTVGFRAAHDFRLELLWQLLLILPIMLIVCAAYYLLVERPCMRPGWPKRLAAYVSRGRLASEVS